MTGDTGDTRYLSVDEVTAIAEVAFGGRPPEARAPGLLASAVHRPRARMFGTAAYDDLYEQGLRRRPWTQVYISRGIGTSRLGVRFLCRPEVAVRKSACEIASALATRRCNAHCRPTASASASRASSSTALSPWSARRSASTR